MSYIKMQKIIKENVDIPEKGYIYFGYDDGGLWIKNDDGTPAYYILAGYGSAPTISSLNPSQGYAGQQISIFGTGFAGDSIVNFGSNQASNVTVLSSTQINVVVPSITTGAISVTVTTQNGTSNSVTFTVGSQTSAPIITPPVIPSSQNVGGIIELNGYNFEIGLTTIYFNYTSATTTVSNQTHLTATIPTITTGQTSVFVETSKGSSNTVTMMVTENTNPTIISFNPTYGYSGDTINITGQNFQTGTTSVKFGSYSATDVSVNSNTALTAKVPSMPIGLTNVYVNTSSLYGFTVCGTTSSDVPHIVSILPLDYGPNQTVVISGTNMSNITTVTFGGVLATILGLGSTYSRNVKIGTNTLPGTNVVYAINSYGQSDPFNYTVGGGSANNPTITDFNPWSGVSGDVVTISGTNFIYGSSVNGVSFAGYMASSFGLSTTQIHCIIPNGVPSGSIDVQVSNINGSVIRSGFIINTIGGTPPVITSISSGYGKGGDTLDIYGQYLADWNGLSWTPGVVKFGFTFTTSTGAAVTALDQTHLQAIIPSGMVTSGNFNTYNIYVTTISGSTQYSPFDIFEPPTQAATITGFYPATGKIKDTITLSGTNFCKYWNVAYIGTVDYTSSPPKPIKVIMVQDPWVSNTYMTAKIPAEVGSYTGQSGFLVENQLGGTEKAGFTITA